MGVSLEIYPICGKCKLLLTHLIFVSVTPVVIQEFWRTKFPRKPWAPEFRERACCHCYDLPAANWEEGMRLAAGNETLKEEQRLTGRQQCHLLSSVELAHLQVHIMFIQTFENPLV